MRGKRRAKNGKRKCTGKFRPCMCAIICFLQLTCVRGRLTVPPLATRGERAKGESLARVRQRGRERAPARVFSAGLKSRPPKMHGTAAARRLSARFPSASLRGRKPRPSTFCRPAPRNWKLEGRTGANARGRARKCVGRLASAAARSKFSSVNMPPHRR